METAEVLRAVTLAVWSADEPGVASDGAGGYGRSGGGTILGLDCINTDLVHQIGEVSTLMHEQR